MSLLGPYGITPKLPQVGDIWRHYKNNDYKVIGFARSEGGSRQVLYVRMARSGGVPTGEIEPEIYSRNIGEWLATVTLSDGHFPRFTLISREGEPVPVELRGLSKALPGGITPL